MRRRPSIAKLIFYATVFALAVRLFLVEDYRIVGESMSPSLRTGDLVFIWKAAFNIRLPFSTYEVVKLRRPVSGEMVAFTLPDRGIDTFVKRVVGTEGDRVEIKNGVLAVNGTEAKYIPRSGDFYTEELGNVSFTVEWAKEKISDFGPIDIPKGYFFVLGDNRVESIDSRTWGPVPYSCLKGRVGMTWMSIAKKSD